MMHPILAFIRSLTALTFPTYAAEELPQELAEIPITKPGS